MVGIASYIQSSPSGTYYPDILNANSAVLQLTANLNDLWMNRPFTTPNEPIGNSKLQTALEKLGETVQ